MESLAEQVVSCPYCGEAIEVLIDHHDVVQHFFTTQLSGFLQFSHLSLILIRAHVAQI